MDIIPRLGRPERRDLLQRGRKSGDPATVLRFLLVAPAPRPRRGEV